jgi:hypothetical protein
MSILSTDEYFRGVDEIKEKLDKIIELLELVTCQIQSLTITEEHCNCEKYESGKLTGSWWWCPVHGHRF